MLIVNEKRIHIGTKLNSRLQELNRHSAEFSPDTERQETEPIPAGNIMDIIYHSMANTWRN